MTPSPSIVSSSIVSPSILTPSPSIVSPSIIQDISQEISIVRSIIFNISDSNITNATNGKPPEVQNTDNYSTVLIAVMTPITLLLILGLIYLYLRKRKNKGVHPCSSINKKRSDTRPRDYILEILPMMVDNV